MLFTNRSAPGSKKRPVRTGAAPDAKRYVALLTFVNHLGHTVEAGSHLHLSDRAAKYLVMAKKIAQPVVEPKPVETAAKPIAPSIKADVTPVEAKTDKA